jgi:hypothetical protein
MQIVLKNVRLAFPNLWEPTTFNGTGQPACSASFIISPDNKLAMETVVAAIKQVATEKWQAKATEMLKTLKAKNDLCLHDGAEKSNYAGFEGNHYVSARNATRPIVIDRDKSPLTQADGRIYAGCYVNVSLDVWAQDNGYGKRINAKLLAVQFVKDGEAFGGGAQGSADAFDDLGDDATEGAAADAGGADPLFG